MIISEEQVRRAAEYLQTQNRDEDRVVASHADEATIEILRRVVDALHGVPDVRADRVDEARELLHGRMPPTEVVASKLIGRVISDSLR